MNCQQRVQTQMLHTGFARAAITSFQKSAGYDEVHVIPVGLNFLHKGTFRRSSFSLLCSAPSRSPAFPSHVPLTLVLKYTYSPPGFLMFVCMLIVGVYSDVFVEYGKPLVVFRDEVELISSEEESRVFCGVWMPHLLLSPRQSAQ